MSLKSEIPLWLIKQPKRIVDLKDVPKTNPVFRIKSNESKSKIGCAINGIQTMPHDTVLKSQLLI